MKFTTLALRLKTFCLVFLLTFCCSIYGYIDLEEMAQDFIIETKKIDIPGYPDAFNPAIVRWNGTLLMSFRTRDLKTGSTNPIGFVWLDDNFNPIGTPQIIQLKIDGLASKSFAQDPRLVVVAESLYIIYNNMVKTKSGLTRRMCVANLDFDGVKFYIKNPDVIKNFPGENPFRLEKSWVPFDYAGNLLLSYSISPHLVFRPLRGTKKCETFAKTSSNINWPWGELRGGTPALVEGDEYLAFFHTYKDMATVHSNGKKISHYFIGAYTFELNPPFAITRISSKPIVAKGFYTGPAYKTWKPLRVVFPMGYVADENYVWLSYGKQDHEVWIAKIDKKALLNSLVPVSSK